MYVGLVLHYVTNHFIHISKTVHLIADQFVLLFLYQFDGPTKTAVSLFCILNGDDLYNTFTGVEVPSNSIQLFSKLFLCAFMILFIYIVLSLFIGIFNHAYESLSVSGCALVCMCTVYAILLYLQHVYLYLQCVYVCTDGVRMCVLHAYVHKSVCVHTCSSVQSYLYACANIITCYVCVHVFVALVKLEATLKRIST